VRLAFRNILLLFIAIAMLLPIQNRAVIAIQGAEQDEITLKALFIYNFTKHIEWPESKSSTSKFSIVIYGHSGITEKLSALLKTRKIRDKAIEIIESTDKEILARASIIFIPKGKIGKAIEIENSIEAIGILYISEETKMPVKGSCINLTLKNEKMKFELNESSLKSEGLKVSNQLLELSIASK
jgi:YfiR/HmsC-like